MRQSRNKLALAVAALSCVSAVYFNHEARAERNYSVYGVRTDFPMDEKHVPQRDIFVNMGSNHGVKIGTYLDVYRSVPTTDDQNQKNAQNISFKVARIKVIHAENGVSVARISEMLPAKDIPNSIYANVMVGDTVEVSRK